MNKTKIFVSSTYFDLEQVREDLRKSITNIGHTPILSEHPSFSVLPDLNTISNCQRNVKENCDIFILIIGGKRGSIDLKTKKSIVNIEYDTAINNNKDIFIFVDERVNNLLEFWRKNKDADFSPSVDDPMLFEFIDSIKSSKKWVFTFKKAEDIVETIKLQLSNFLKHLIDRKNVGKLDPIKEFLDENERIQQLALEKPDYWEYKLTIELLRTRYSAIDRKFKELEDGIYFIKTNRIDGLNYFQIVGSKFNELQKILTMMERILNEEFLKAWGLPGIEGNPIEIKYVVNKLDEACQACFEWEKDIRSYDPSEKFDTLKNLLIGAGKSLYEEIRNLPDKIELPFLTERPVLGEYIINLKFSPPTNFEKINRELDRLGNDFDSFIY